MAKKSLKVKARKKQKFSTRQHNRCQLCGRPRSYMRNMEFVAYAS